MDLRNILIGFGVAVTCIAFQSCSEDEKGGYTPVNYNVNGKVEKGPFVSGSTIDVQPMDAEMQPLGSIYSTTISDNTGSFSFGSKEFETPFAQLKANGYFFNEVDGQLSRGTLTLMAVVNLADQSTVNVNILTHLKYKRIINLTGQNKSYSDANKQAQKELLTAFGLQRFLDVDVSQYSITTGSDEAGALLAISSLLLVDRSEAVLTEYLAKLSEEFGQEGKFSETSLQQIKKDRNKLNSKLPSIASNVVSRYNSLGKTVSVKDLAYFFDWNDDGIAGNEIAGNGTPVTLETSRITVPKEGGEYSIKISTSIPLTLDTQESDGIHSIHESMFDKLYETPGLTLIKVEKALENNVLKVNIKPSASRRNVTDSVAIYDFRDQKVAILTISQEGDPSAPLPKLGEAGVQAFYAYASSLSEVITSSNTLEAKYSGITTDWEFRAPLSSSNGNINDIFSKYYRAINRNLIILEADATRESAYPDYLNTFNAICYYNMVVYWGGVPYLTTVPDLNSLYLPRTSEKDIFQALTSNLETAISKSDEKKNRFATSDLNDLLFVSKDVARIILANIHMYQSEYSKAKSLLAKVVSNNFYQLESTTSYTPTSKELILGLFNTPILTYTDVLLSLAECEAHLGNDAAALNYLKMVTRAKGIAETSDVITGIKEARKIALTDQVGYFAFLKRNGLAKSELKLEDYQLLFPIPQREIDINPGMTQNPGY
ncbi:MAG: RagB/SusD family nutrient uptake outer membrane protein [Macellibacteroides sp.]|uniref:RagB/SusD family nutrient uptake outer membrane protein n=1 Tax=Macellibacteroides sp. TaxID=2014584 RepID=UPI003E7B5575